MVYLPPALTISPYPYMGIVKSYDIHRKFGYIMSLYRRDIFFHIKNSNILNIKPNMVVAFKVRESPISKRVEAYDIDTLINYKGELLEHQNNLLVGDVKFVYYCNPEIIEYELQKLLKEELDLLSSVDEYVDCLDIKHIIESYNVIVATVHRNKPGDDDSIWIYYSGDRKEGKFMIENRKKIIQDIYLDTLLPIYTEEIYHDYGFCPWQQMLEEFGDLTSYQKDAIGRTEKIKNKASRLYDKQKHKETIVQYLEDRIKNMSKLYKHELEQNINDTLKYGYKIETCINGVFFDVEGMSKFLF